MKTFKVGDTVPFRVRTNGDPSTDNPTATIYDESNTPLPTPLTLGAGLTQIGSKKIVTGSFVVNAGGQWSVNITDDQGMDLVKEYIVRAHSVESIGNSVAGVGAGVATVEGKVDAQDLVLAAILAQTQGGGHFG